MRRLALPVALLALCATAACSPTDQPRTDGTKPAPGLAACGARGVVSQGEALPDCLLEGMAGEQDVQIGSLLGKPAVLNFWASWCPQCVHEMPAFQEVFASLDGAVAFVGINVLNVLGETRGAAETFRERTGVRYRMVFDPGGQFYARFQPNVQRPVLPITIFAGADGMVVRKQFGELTRERLESAIAELFGVGG